VKYDFLIVASFKYDENILRTRLMVQELHRRGYSAFVVTTSALGDREMGRHGVPFRNLRSLLAESTNGLEVDDKTCREVAQRYGLINLVDFVSLHCQMFRTDVRTVVGESVKTFLAFERLFERHEFGCLHQYNGGEIFRRVASRVAKRHGVPVLYYDFAPFPGKIRFSLDEGGTWAGLGDGAGEVSESQLGETRKHIRETVERAVPFFSAQPVRAVPRFGRILCVILSDVFRKYALNRGSEYEPLLSAYWGMFLRRVRRKRQEGFCRLPDSNEQCMFFPLHYPIESTLMIRARPFVYQEWLVEYITRSIPQGYMLYVKEHPYSPGNFPTGFVRRLSKIPNVRWLRPEVNSYEVIQKASAVIVINSTAGFEALLCGRPVVTLAPSYYADRGVTIDVRDLSRLPEALARAVGFTPDREVVVRLVARMREASYDGPFWTDSSPIGVSQTIDALIECCSRCLPGWTRRSSDSSVPAAHA